MKFARQFFLLTLVACTGLLLSACEPSKAKAPEMPTLQSISIAPGAASVPISSTQPLVVTATYSDGSTLVVTSASSYSSSATAVATVSSSGVVTAVSAGTATITATISGQSATATITVPPAALVSIALRPTTVTLAPGGARQLTVIGTYNEGSQGDLTDASTFASSNPAVATVGAAGEVTGVAEGTATITATHTDSGKTATSLVTVTPAAPIDLVNGVWSSNYSQIDPSNWRSIEGGDAGTYIDGSVATAYWWNGVAPGDATPSFYFGYGINVNAKPWGFGAFVKAPGNAVANVSDYTNIRIAVWGNDELMSTSPTLTVILKGPTIAGCTSELEGSIAVTSIGAQTYDVALDSLALKTGCAFTNVAEALAAGVAEVHIQVLGDNVQYVTAADDLGNYANGLNVGPISFNSETGSNLIDLVDGVWSSNYSQVDGSNWTSAEGGAAGRYIDGSVATLDWWNGVAPDDATPNFYFGYGINVATPPWGFGAFVNAPGNAAANVSGYTNVEIAVWGNNELMSTSPTLTVLLLGPEVDGCTPTLAGSIAVTGTGVQTYVVALDSFTLQAACGYGTVAEALAAGLVGIHVQVLGDNVQYVTAADDLGNYANGLNVGPISFNSDSSGPASVVWSSNYTQVDGSNWTSAEGGAAGRYIDGSVATLDWWNGVAPGDATPNFYFGYGINVATPPWGFGAFVSAPENGVLDLSGYINAIIAVWGNDELMSTGPTLTVLLRGPDVGGCAAVLQGSIEVNSIGAQTYTVPLASFALQTACTYTSVAEVLAAGIAQVHIQVLGVNVQYVTPADDLGNYANGLNVGPISFN